MTSPNATLDEQAASLQTVIAFCRREANKPDCDNPDILDYIADWLNAIDHASAQSETAPIQPDAERVAQLVAHRVCCGTEHDAANGKLHGYCVVCGVPWPCEYAGKPPKHGFLDVVFDGPPSHESGRFVEVEDENGKSVNAGEWIDRKDGLWALRIKR